MISSNWVPLFDFNTCKHYSCDVCDWFCSGLLYWSKRMACMVLYGGLNSYWECIFVCAMYICLSINIDLCIHE